MRPEVEIKCSHCGATSLKSHREIVRQQKKGRYSFFCSLNCAAKHGNLPRIKKDVQKQCSFCGKEFLASGKVVSATFCSRGCASAGSVTDKRREVARRIGLEQAANLEPQIGAGLKVREAWKYVELEQTLKIAGMQYEFEFVLENRVFDLFLPELKKIVEFDGPEHRKYPRLESDVQKDLLALRHGFQVLRVGVKPASVIPVSALEVLFSQERNSDG